ncbi:hypothetical protein BSZ05_20120 [Vibrio mediterranei]|uniref:SURF1-like protein n=1 Tax=Vibrio mediterranei TaxID=689 RepID=A0AAN1FK47_9VIBR|nr:hypothetical protein BSZ05_20120 [Vibrio mediterranei]
MKSNSSTKTILNNSVGDIEVPRVAWFKSVKFWVGFVLTVVVFSTLVKLGLWQLQRGNDKSHMESMLAQRSKQSPISLSSVHFSNTSQSNSDYLDWIGVPVFAEVTPLPELFYLDNQTFEGQVGYVVYQLIIDGQSRFLLLELGFVKGMEQRQSLPVVEQLTHPLMITGRLYQKLDSPLGNELYPEDFTSSTSTRFRIQNLNIGSLAELTGKPLQAWALQPIDSTTPYAHPWKPLSMNSTKHYGYAFQWFSMALVFAFVVGIAVYRWARKTHSARH